MELSTNTAKNLPEEDKGVGETVQYIVIRLGNEQYGIDIRYIDNIVRMQPITRIPKMPPYLKGVINMRGEVNIVTYIDGPFYPDENLKPKERQQELRDRIYQCMTERSRESDIEVIQYRKAPENQGKETEYITRDASPENDG